MSRVIFSSATLGGVGVEEEKVRVKSLCVSEEQILESEDWEEVKGMMGE